MDESEYLKGRLEALSLIVGAMFAEMPQKEARFGPKLMYLAHQHFTDTPLGAQSAEFRSGFQKEFDRVISTLETPVASKSSG